MEVAGYEIGAELAAAIDALDMSQLGSAALGPVTWIEVTRVGVSRPSHAAKQCIDGWKARGLTVATQCVEGVAFWSSSRKELIPNLIAATCAAFASAP